MKKNYYKEITDKIIKLINENKELPWRKPWTNITYKNRHSFNYAVDPYNPVTGTVYKALNNMILTSLSPFDTKEDPRFLTYKNIQDCGLKLKEGQGKNYQTIYFMGIVDKNESIKITNPDNPKTPTDTFDDKSDAKEKTPEETIEVKNKVFATKSFRVYHASQIEGIPKYEMPLEFKAIDEGNFEHIGNLIKNAEIKVLVGGNRAFYKPSSDHIQMPPLTSFQNENGFYSTLLHEIGHWTMKEDRVYRPTSMGKEDYAKEELVAELFSVTAAKPFGLVPQMEQSSAYLKSWLKHLNNDQQFLFRASSYAQRATEFCMEKAGIKPVLKVSPQIKVLDMRLKEKDIPYPFYGLTKKQLEPFLDDLLNNKKSKPIPGMVSPRTGKPFKDAVPVLLKKIKDEVKVQFFFPKRKFTKNNTYKKSRKNSKTL